MTPLATLPRRRLYRSGERSEASQNPVEDRDGQARGEKPCVPLQGERRYLRMYGLTLGSEEG